MLFADGASALVRLSDALKVSLSVLEETTRDAVVLIEAQSDALREAQRIAKEVLARRSSEDPLARMGSISKDHRLRIVVLETRIHAQALNIVLLSCFTLEAYINSFAHFLLKEYDFLGLLRDGRKASAQVPYEAIERLSPKEKWNDVRRLTSSTEFDPSKRPWQDFKIVFAFRDDHVHDKVVPYSEERARKRYGGKLPDPAGGLLDLGHALYAATTYWDMVMEIHALSTVPMKEFHRHYDPSPWPSQDFARGAEVLAKRYRVALHPT
jgi:hypothetical protein